MPVASVSASSDKKKQSIIIIAVVAVLAVISAVLFIVLNQQQTSQDRAAQTVPTKSIPSPKPTVSTGTGSPGGSGALCKPEGATCAWKVDLTATSSTVSQTTFNYEIRDETTGQIVKSGNTSTFSVTFTPTAGHTYSCTITPVNICAKGAPAKTQASCKVQVTPTPPSQLSVTPTPTSKLTPTPTSKLTATPTPTGALSSTPTPTISVTPSVTPTGTITPTRTPTPTEIIIVSATNTPAVSSTPTSGSGTTSTPVPPAAGVTEPAIAILIFAAFVILLGLIF